MTNAPSVKYVGPPGETPVMRIFQVSAMMGPTEKGKGPGGGQNLRKSRRTCLGSSA
jgi:hypothetical protein